MPNLNPEQFGERGGWSVPNPAYEPGLPVWDSLRSRPYFQNQSAVNVLDPEIGDPSVPERTRDMRPFVQPMGTGAFY